MLYNRENKNDVTGVPTGFVDLDRMTSGLQPGDLIIVAARPSMGKTALALNMAEHVALRQECRWRVQHGNVGRRSSRCACSARSARVDQHELRTGTLKDDDWPQLVDAVGKLNEAQIYIDETRGRSTRSSCARARGACTAQCGGLGLIVVDYLQLMSGTGGSRDENRATEIAEISRSLKSARQGAEGAGGRAVAAEPQRRRAPGQAADDVRPARIGRDRAGRRRDPVHLPRRGLQPGLAGARASPRSSSASSATARSARSS